jgi:CRP/FNR family cyclic AMP-dependent transcriptional regulator
LDFTREEEMISIEWLKKTELFRTLSDSQLSLLLSHSSVESFPEGETIFRQGDDANRLYILAEGSIDLSVKTGEKVDFLTSKIEKEGSTFGIPSLIEPFRYNVTASCLKPSKVFVIDAIRVRMEMERDPKMGVEILKKLVSIYFNRLNETRSGVSNFLEGLKFKT